MKQSAGKPFGSVVSLFLLTGLALIAAPKSTEAFYEVQIATDPAIQIHPAISGDRIVWEDYRNGNPDIFLYDLTTNTETRITTDPAIQTYPVISGDRIVWNDYRNGNYDIYLYDLTTNTETRITTDPANQFNPAISGDRIVWHDFRNGNSDIYLYDLTTNTETRITTDPANQFNPAISGDRIVWIDARDGDRDIYLYDLTTNTETRIAQVFETAGQCNPAISGDRIVWHDFRNWNWDIYIYDLTTKTETRITTNPAIQSFPAISEDRIVWYDGRNGDWDIYLYDLTTNTETRITTDPAHQLLPAISGDRIVWIDGRNGNWENWDIYLVTLGPDIDVSPLSYDFGEVEAGFSTETIVTVSNAGNQDLTITNACLTIPEIPKCDVAVGLPFNLGKAPSLPAFLSPGNTLDLPLTFAPERAGIFDGLLAVESNDPHQNGMPVWISLSGTGVPGELPPSQQVEQILATTEASVARGTLSGSGQGASAGGRLNAFTNMIEAAGDLIENGQIAEACQQLSDAYKRTDGVEKPPDFLAGTDAATVAAQIQTLMTGLNCP